MSILENINSPHDLKKLDISKLKILAAEIRSFLINSVAKTGGHLASNLGVVELTIALHRVFNAPEDVLVWDVGHQSYVHKILTGRREEFENLRKYGGISGFPRASESEYDAFDGGHSSTSISAALGFACARDLQNKSNSVVAIIGDGAMTGGLAYEGLNNAGRMKTNFIVVLNNNEMSIARNVGSMSKYLNQLRTGNLYNKAKKDVVQALNKVPFVGNATSVALQSIKDSIKHMIFQSTIFEELGFTCFGPIDGHDINQMIDVLQHAKAIEGPVMVHVYTKKGKGYSYAERSPSAFHGIGKFDVETGIPNGKKTDYISTSKIFGEALVNIAKENPKVLAITAAMPDGTGLDNFAKELPKRFFDVGIAEQHAVTFAGGLAKSDEIPVVAVYSTFLQRAYDQIFHDVALQNLHVVFALDRAGLVGEDGETHHGIYDLSYLSHLPNVSVLAPSNPQQLTQMLNYAINFHKGPIAIRYPKFILNEESQTPFTFGKACVERTGNDITVIAEGNMLNTALKAAELSGESVEVIDVRTIKPIDSETIISSINKTGRVITIEDNVKFGGLGSMVEQITNIPITKLGYGNSPVTHGDLETLYKINGVDVKSVADIIKKECNNEKAS